VLTRAKALQTVSRSPRETRRRYAVPKSNAFTPGTLEPWTSNIWTLNPVLEIIIWYLHLFVLC